jgi:hypothetical protein
VAHAQEALQETVDDRTRSAAGRIGEEADAAGVALAAQVVDQRLQCSTPSYECELPACCCDLAGGGGGMKRRLARKDALGDDGKKDGCRRAFH